MIDRHKNSENFRECLIFRDAGGCLCRGAEKMRTGNLRRMLRAACRLLRVAACERLRERRERASAPGGGLICRCSPRSLLPETSFFVRTFWPQKVPKTLPTASSATSGVLTLAPGAYSRVCKQTGPFARAFSPPCVRRLGIESGCSVALRAVCLLVAAVFPGPSGRRAAALGRRRAASVDAVPVVCVRNNQQVASLFFRLFWSRRAAAFAPRRPASLRSRILRRLRPVITDL